MPAGRPTKYNPDVHPESYIELSKKGKTKAQICAAWGIGHDTLHRWEHDESKSEFQEAIKKGDAARQDWWVNEGVKLMQGEYQKGNPTPWIFIMKNCFGWRDKQETTHDIQASKGKLTIDLGAGNDFQDGRKEGSGDSSQ